MQEIEIVRTIGIMLISITCGSILALRINWKKESKEKIGEMKNIKGRW